MKQIFEDVRFFERQGIIDYSMILYKARLKKKRIMTPVYDDETEANEI